MGETTSLSKERIRDFVIAGHGNLAKVKEMLATDPALLNVSHEWKADDWETAIQGAAHVGNPPIAEFLLERGAPLEFCTAAMLGRSADVTAMLAQKPELIQSRGAHQIPLLAHAALSGDVALFDLLVARGASEGMSFALSNAVSKGHLDLARWVLQHGNPDLDWLNFMNMTPLQIAEERGNGAMVALLKSHVSGPVIP